MYFAHLFLSQEHYRSSPVRSSVLLHRISHHNFTINHIVQKSYLLFHAVISLPFLHSVAISAWVQPSGARPCCRTHLLKPCNCCPTSPSTTSSFTSSSILQSRLCSSYLRNIFLFPSLYRFLTLLRIPLDQNSHQHCLKTSYFELSSPTSGLPSLTHPRSPHSPPSCL